MMNGKEMERSLKDYNIMTYIDASLKDEAESGSKIIKLRPVLEEYQNQLVLVNKVIELSNFEKNPETNKLEKISEEGWIYIETGLLAQPYIDYKPMLTPSLEIIVSQNLILDFSKDDKIDFSDDNMKISIYDFNKKNLSFVSQNAIRKIRIKNIDLHFGNENVKTFLVNNYKESGLKVYDEINDFLRDPEKTKKRREEKSINNTLSEIEELLEQERNFSRKIKFIYDSVKDGGFEEDGRFINVEDNDQALLVSWPIREFLNNVRYSINKELEIAVNLGMHTNSSQYFFEHRDGEVTKNLSEFVLKLLSIYKKDQAI